MLTGWYKKENRIYKFSSPFVILFYSFFLNLLTTSQNKKLFYEIYIGYLISDVINKRGYEFMVLKFLHFLKKYKNIFWIYVPQELPEF